MKQVFGIFSLLFIFLSMNGETLNWNKGRGYSPFAFSTSDGIRLYNTTDSLIYDYYGLPSESSEFKLRFRSKNLHGNPSKKYIYLDSSGKECKTSHPFWGFYVACDADTILVTSRYTEIFNGNEETPGLEVELSFSTIKRREKVNIYSNLNPYDGDNLWDLRIDGNDFILSGGDHGIKDIIRFPFNFNVLGFGFYSSWGGNVLISDISIEYQTGREAVDGNGSFNSLEEIEEHLKESEDPMEGYWTLFDREFDESLLKAGGIYTLACIKEGDGYNLLYVDGASVNSKAWKQGELKVRLTPTPFVDIYNVEWIDAMKQPFNFDIKAQKGEGHTLQFQFPYQSSKFRLRKIPR